MSTPPPLPGGSPGGSDPYDPSTSGQPSGAGQPPQPPPAGPPPGPGGYGSAPPPAGPTSSQGGRDQTKILSFVSMGTGIAGIIICCCWGLPIFSLIAVITGYIANKDMKASGRTDVRAFVLIGLITGVIGLIIGVVYWILVATGNIELNTTWDTSNM